MVLTADHGGHSGKAHSKADKLVNHQIPFLVWDLEWPRGANLYALNPQLRRPWLGANHLLR